MSARIFVTVLLVTVVVTTGPLESHSGPPFPIVSDQSSGPYVVSIWTDPDTTDDGSAKGQFWVRVRAADGGITLPQQTRVRLTATSTTGPSPVQMATASPVRGDATNQFAAVVLDREGRFAVLVEIDGALGTARVESAVDATYDLRPPRLLFILYLLPFVLAGLLWGRLLLRRRAGAAAARRSH
jgi:hypothetical protein